MSDYQEDKAIIDALTGLSKPKKTTSKLPPISSVKPTDGLLASLDAAAKRQKSGTTPTGLGYEKSTDIDFKGEIGGLAKHLLVPLTALDTPRRAVISGLRELVDVLDSDPNSKGSFGDFWNQTKDSSYGFGTAFPMKGWMGRVTGFLGDVLFDPLTYATLGGTVAAKSVVKISAKELAKMAPADLAKLAVKKQLSDGSVEVATRSVIGKTVVGREGRQKLAEFSRKRMNQMVESGSRQISPQEINRIAGEIASEGKKALRQAPWLADDIGIKGPGVYYFGSRVKVPGSGAIGKALESGLVSARLGAVNSNLLGKMQEALTPKGVGRIDQFGPNAIRDFRVRLARGGMSPDEVNLALSVVEADDLKRMRLADYADEAAAQIENDVDVARSTTIPMHRLLDNVADPASVPGATPEDIIAATTMRGHLNRFIQLIQDRAAAVGGRMPGKIEQGYFPRMETDDALRWRLKVGNEGADNIMYGGMADDIIDEAGDVIKGAKPVDKTRTASVFKERDLKAGDTWFGHTLRPEDMSAERLNFLARNGINGAESVTFDLFETDIANVMAKYVRSYSDQMSTYDMLDNLATEHPEILSFLNKTLGIDPAYAKEKLVDAPSRALNDMTVALRNLSTTQENGVGAVDVVLREMYGSLEAAKAALANGTMNQADLDEFHLALRQVIDDVGAKNEQYLRLFRAFDDQIADVDGVSNYLLIAGQRERLAAEFADIKNMMDDVSREAADGTKNITSQNLEQIRVKLAEHMERVKRFERDLSEMNDVHDVLPTLGAHDEIGGRKVFDVLNDIVKTEKQQVGIKTKVQNFIETALGKNSSRYGWDEAQKKSLSGMKPEMVYRDLAYLAAKKEPLTNAESKELVDIARYIFVLMDSNEQALGINQLINDRARGLTKINGKQTRFGMWQQAFDSIKSGLNKDGYILQDLLNEELSLQQYLEMRDILAPYGVNIGDDVIDEIIKRNAEPLINEALKSGDTARLEQLRDPKYGFRNIEDKSHPLSLQRRTQYDREVVDDIVREMDKWSKLNKIGPKTVVKTFEDDLEQMTPIERKAYTKWRRSNLQLRDEYRKTVVANRKELVTADGALLQNEAAATAIREKIAQRFRKSAAQSQQTISAWVNDFDKFLATVSGVLRESELTNASTFDNWLKANRKLINIMKRLGPDVANIKPGDEGYAVIRRKFLDAGIDFEGIDKSVINILLDSLDSHADNSIDSALHASRSLRDDIQRTITNTESRLYEIDEVIGMRPKDFIETGQGTVARRELLVAREPGERAVQPGVSEMALGDRATLKRIYNELINSDAYPIHKSVQNRANIVHALADLKDGIDFRGIRFTADEWDAIVNGDNLDDAVTGKLRQIVVQAKMKQTLEMTAPGELLERGADNISDEYAVKKYVEFIIGQNSDNAVDSVVASARRKRIEKNWRSTESYKKLTEVNTVRARLIETTRTAKAGDRRRLLDRAGMAADNVAGNNEKIAQQLSDWTPQDTDELAVALQQALDVKNVPQAPLQQVYRPGPEELLNDLGPSLVVNPRLANVEDLSSNSLTLLENARAGRNKLDRVLKTPLETKSQPQLEEELKLLEILKSEGIETDYTKGQMNKLIRERRKLIQSVQETPLRETDYTLTPQQRLAQIIDERKAAQSDAMDLMMNPEDSAAWRQVDSGADVRETTQRAVQDELNVMAKSPDELADASTTRSVFGKEGDLASDWDDPLFYGSRDKVVGKGAKPTKTQGIPDKTIVDELRVVAGLGSRSGQQTDRTLQIVNDLRSRYDSLAAVQAEVDPARLGVLEQNIKDVMSVLQDATTSQRATVRGASDRAQITADYAMKQGDLYERHQVGKKVMQDAMRVVKHIGSKDQIDAIDVVILNQAEAEVQFWQTAMRLSDAQVEERTVAGIQQMIDGGGRVMDDGRILLSTGELVDGLPVEAFAEVGRSLKAGWQQLDQKYFPGLQASPEFKQLWDAATRIEDPEFVRKLAYYIGPYTKFFKAYATLSPGFHVRNAISNAMQLILADADVDNMIKATPYYFKWLKAQKSGLSWDDFLKTVEPEMVKPLNVARRGALGGGGGIFSETFKEATGGSRIYDNWLIRKNQAIGQASDNYSRFVLAFDSAMKGGDAGLAQARVKRFFFDYEDLSSVDKVMRQIIPFWLFYSRNMSTQITNMWLNPKPYLIYNSFKRNFEGEDPAPPFVREMGGFRLPFGEGLYAMPDIGFTRIPQELSDLTNPMKMLNKMNPLLKVPAEQIAGKSAFTGKEFDTGQERLMAALVGLAPPAGQAERLVGRDGLSQLNAWLGYLGSPIRKYN